MVWYLPGQVPARANAPAVMEAVEMKHPLQMTAAIALNEARDCLADARQICVDLNDGDKVMALEQVISELKPIAEAMNASAGETAGAATGGGS